MQNDLQKVLQVNRLSPEPIIDETDGSVTIFLYEDVTEESVNRVIGEIINHRDFSIQLHIKTTGGSAYDALALVDTIRDYGVQVHVNGFAFSAGFIIFCASHIRTMGENALLMYHDLSYGLSGTKESQRSTLKVMDRLTEKLHNVIVSNTNISKEKLKECDSKHEDWYLEFDEAEELGLITHKMVSEEQVVQEEMVVPQQVEIIKNYVEVGKKEECEDPTAGDEDGSL